MKVWGITGWKNSGKTRLVSRLVTEFTARGLTVSTIKHASHGFDIDQSGTDSDQHRQAGATEVLISSGRRWALMHELSGPEPGLEALLAHLSPVDLILVEGFKNEAHPKIEAHRATTGHPLIAPDNPTVRAIAADTAIHTHGLRRFDLDDIPSIADFIAGELGL